MKFISNRNPIFRHSFAETIFQQKYAHEGAETWDSLCKTLVDDVCGGLMSKSDRATLIDHMQKQRAIAGGRYLYYAGRPNKFFNNCVLGAAIEDTREDWADLSWKAESALMTGAGFGIDFSVYRAEGALIQKTGGVASGPVSKANMINEIGRRVMQGGSRRSALYGSLSCDHPDAMKFMHCKDWAAIKVPGTAMSMADLKALDFQWPCPLDGMNISLNYGTEWLENYKSTGDVGATFLTNAEQALRTGEPGFSFNFYSKEKETLRNPCCEVVSEDADDMCCLGSINLSKIENIEQMQEVTELMTKFLICGTIKGKLPYAQNYVTREKNRRIGLGLMGVAEWLIQRGYRYEVVPELHNWLAVYRDVSSYSARVFADSLSVSRPVATRAIAPTGSIGILAGTTTGIEPLFAVAYKRRYLKNGTETHYQYVVDGTAQFLIDQYGADPDNIESAIDLAADYERRIAFQADVQDYVDMAISSTINLPSWGSELNNEDKVKDFAECLAKYAPRLRGFTVYPDGARGGQPLTPVDYREAVKNLGTEFRETVEHVDICDISGKGGTCGA